jgi:hypothetical protein
MKNSDDKPEAAKPVRVWGLAAGRGSTREAAPGALCWMEYPGRDDIPLSDWRAIICIEPGKRPVTGLEEHE